MDEPPTKPRRPSSLQKISLWGLVHVWLARDLEGRGLMIQAGPQGLRVTLVDTVAGREDFEDVGPEEDPARAALRVMERLSAAEA